MVIRRYVVGLFATIPGSDLYEYALPSPFLSSTTVAAGRKLMRLIFADSEAALTTAHI